MTSVQTQTDLACELSLSISLPVDTDTDTEMDTHAPMAWMTQPEYTACSCGHPVKNCVCPTPIPYVARIYEFPTFSPFESHVALESGAAAALATALESAKALESANAFANGDFYSPEVEAEAGIAFNAWAEQAVKQTTDKECPNCGLFQCSCVFDEYDSMYPRNYCYSCKGDCTTCDCQDFAQSLLTHSSTASQSVSSFHALQKAYESMGLVPATGWAADFDAAASATGVTDKVCDNCHYNIMACECEYLQKLYGECFHPKETCDCIFPLCEDCRNSRPYCLCHPPCTGCNFHPHYCECHETGLCEQCNGNEAECTCYEDREDDQYDPYEEERSKSKYD